ncbi:hypothetical protein [Sodalis sp. RH20]|uniref:hypothetical protein n=2 Tax=Sodalis TaxID=84565 RepID=UPI0039B594F0
MEVMMRISGSVGHGGVNNPAEVAAVQTLLQANGFSIRNDGACNHETIRAMKRFQTTSPPHPDGMITSTGKTLKELSAGRSPDSPTATGQESGHADSGRLTVSAGQVTFDAEGNDDPSSLYFSRQLHWPQGVSGVTLGRGYDMGGRNKKTIFAELIRAGIPADRAEIISRANLLQGVSAQQFVLKHKKECGVISREAQARLFEIVYPAYVLRAKAIYEYKTARFPARTAWEALKPAIRDIAVDFVYQGLGFERTMKACMGNDIKALIHFIETNDQLKVYEKGRQRANYLRKYQ